MTSHSIKSHSLVATLAVLTAFCPPVFAQTVDTDNHAPFDKHAVSYPSGAKLYQSVGKRITAKGQLMNTQNGRVCIIISGKPDTQISIDPLPCPTLGELPFKFVVNEYGQTTKKPKYHRKSPATWMKNDERQKKLDRLLEQNVLGSYVEATGKLCHMTATISGNVQKNIGYPRIPDSHFFFSVDDITLNPVVTHPQTVQAGATKK